jgi:hypothetical protein
VIVAGGASLTVGLAGCGGDQDSDPPGAKNTGGAGATGGEATTGGAGGAPSSGGAPAADAAPPGVDSGGDGAAEEGGEMTCDCSPPDEGWVICNGVCCWMNGSAPCCA